MAKWRARRQWQCVWIGRGELVKGCQRTGNGYVDTAGAIKCCIERELDYGVDEKRTLRYGLNSDSRYLVRSQAHAVGVYLSRLDQKARSRR